MDGPTDEGSDGVSLSAPSGAEGFGGGDGFTARDAEFGVVGLGVVHVGLVS